MRKLGDTVAPGDRVMVTERNFRWSVEATVFAVNNQEVQVIPEGYGGDLCPVWIDRFSYEIESVKR